jgi:hypothetical protein
MKRVLILALAVVSLGCSAPIEYVRDEYLRDEEIRNPYPPGSGHHAGYEWARQNEALCASNSESFNEGCEEYRRQLTLSGR